MAALFNLPSHKFAECCFIESTILHWSDQSWDRALKLHERPHKSKKLETMSTYVAGLTEPHGERHHSPPAGERQDMRMAEIGQNSVSFAF